MSKFYDAFKLICNMYGNIETNKHENLPGNAVSFVKKYTELNNHYITEDTAYSQIMSALSTDYNNLRNKCSNIPSLLEKKIEQTTVIRSENNFEQTSAQTSEVTSSSSLIGNKLFTVLSVFGAIAFFLGISYKVNNKELKIYFHYIYASINKNIIHFLTFYIAFVIWISETSSKTIFKRKNKKYKEENES
ncbi:Plasmodium variant antigen protein Cir/Yir/Bir, putative, partial [Plasmodium berghei]